MALRGAAAAAASAAIVTTVSAAAIQPLYVGSLHPGNAVRFCELVGQDDARRGKFSLEIVTGSKDGTSVAKSFEPKTGTLAVWIEAAESWRNCDFTISGLEVGKHYVENGMNARLEADFTRKTFDMVKGMLSFGYARSKNPASPLVPVKLH